MRSALAGLRASPDFSFDNFGFQPKIVKPLRARKNLA
jgi:hypothetical protein